MKILSLHPWFRKELPLLKGLLLYGNHEGLITFRRKYLQKIYQQQSYQTVFVTNADEALEQYHSLPELFDRGVSQKCIVLEGVTDSFLSKIKTMVFLCESSHFLLLSSSKLASRSKLVTAFQENLNFGVFPSYEVNKEEIFQSCQKILKERQCYLSKEAFDYLVDFLVSNIDIFFSLMEMIVLYTGAETLEEANLKQLLLSFQSFPVHSLNQYFFQEQTENLQSLMTTIETSEWVRLIRFLLQDVRVLLALQAYDLKVSDLKTSWSKGPVKFPYPHLSLYEKVYSKWSLDRCGLTLKALIKLERDLKSTSAPLSCEIFDLLSRLSSHRNIT